MQKDLITMAIKNIMLGRQQTQLQEYFHAQKDCLFIITPEGALQYFNKAAEQLFERLSQPEVKLDFACFTTTSREKRTEDVPQSEEENLPKLSINDILQQDW